MKTFIFLLTVTTTLADKCPYRFENKYYKKETVLTIKGLPTNLVYNPNTNDLLFTLIDETSLLNENVQTKMDQYILINNAPVKIDNVNGQAAAVDTKCSKVYIGSDEGLYILNTTITSKADFLSFKNEDIVQLFHARNESLYATTYPHNILYKINTETFEKERVDDVPCAIIFAVDSNKNIFYECDSKYVKMLLDGFHEPIEFVGLPKDTARAFAVDDNDRVILAASDGLYHLKSSNIIPDKLMTLDFVPTGVSFDGDDFFISADGVIFKFSSDDCEIIG